MPIPSPADFRNKTKKHSEVREMLAEMAANVPDRSKVMYSYASLTEANADIANIPIGISVWVSSETDSGEYRKEEEVATSLTKSPYGAADRAIKEAKGYVDQSVKKGVGEVLFAIIDSNENSVMSIDSEAGLHVEGLDGTVQDNILGLGEQVKPLAGESTLNNLFTLIDDDGNPVIQVKPNGYLYIFGMQKSLQEQLDYLDSEIKLVNKNNNVKSINLINKRDLFISDYVDLINHLKISSSAVCPVPKYMAKQRFALGQNWLNTIKLTIPSERVIVPGFDPSWNTDIGVVHPQIIEFEERMAGFKYWLGLNPYTGANEDIELPYIYGSNDPELKTWELISDFPTPFDRDPQNVDGVTSGFCSDSGFVYDAKRGDLIFYWRRSLRYGTTTEDGITNEIVARSTSDGKKWSDHFWLRNAYIVNNGSEVDQMLSPIIVFNTVDDLFYMYSISNGKMYYRTTKDIRSRQWSVKTKISIPAFPNVSMWHFDMRFVGNKLVAMIYTDQPDGYYFAVSEDMHNFSVSPSTIVTNTNPNLYKPTFLPILSDNTLKMRCIFTTDPYSTPKWQLKVADTTIESIGD